VVTTLGVAGPASCPTGVGDAVALSLRAADSNRTFHRLELHCKTLEPTVEAAPADGMVQLGGVTFDGGRHRFVVDGMLRGGY
jgi:hypothetical protein